MYWSTYKQLCNRPDVVSRWMILSTAELLKEGSSARQALVATLARSPLPRPQGHGGDARVDMFELSLPVAVIREIAARVRAARRAGIRVGGRGLGGFSEAWDELLRHAEATGDAAPCAGDA